jgi:hypothetical protein
VPLVFNVDDTPAVLTTTNGLTVDDHVALGADNGEGNHALKRYRSEELYDCVYEITDTDGVVLSQLFFVILVGIERVQADVVMNEFRADLQTGMDDFSG